MVLLASFCYVSNSDCLMHENYAKRIAELQCIKTLRMPDFEEPAFTGLSIDTCNSMCILMLIQYTFKDINFSEVRM